MHPVYFFIFYPNKKVMPTVLKRIRVEFQEQVKQGNGICTATTQEPEPSKLRLKRQEPLTRINTDH
jgi:hypothetical protein